MWYYFVYFIRILKLVSLHIEEKKSQFGKTFQNVKGVSGQRVNVKSAILKTKTLFIQNLHIFILGFKGCLPQLSTLIVFSKHKTNLIK